MKKVLVLLLILTAVFMLFSCESTQPDETQDVVDIIVEPVAETTTEKTDFPLESGDSLDADIDNLLCPECGEAISDDWFYCAWCGIKVRDDGKEIPWHSLASLSELEGTWISEDGTTVHYPDYSLGTGVAMVSITWPTKDDTTLWRQLANRLGYTLDKTWMKRNILKKEIYGPVLIDENGTQKGVLCTKNAFNFICSNEIVFIPEKIVRDNTAFFEISPDGTQLTMKGNFHFFSNLAFQLNGDEAIYTKLTDEDQQ